MVKNENDCKIASPSYLPFEFYSRQFNMKKNIYYKS